MAGMTVTEDRLQSVNFSDTYATGVQVVNVPEDSAITSVDDLFAEGAAVSYTHLDVYKRQGQQHCRRDLQRDSAAVRGEGAGG